MRNKPPRTIPITVAVPVTLLDAYEAQAQAQGVSRASLVRADLLAGFSARAPQGGASKAPGIAVEEHLSQLTDLLNV